MDNLLKLLESDARMSTADLAVALGCTEAAVAAQIEAYEKSGVILGYKTLINWELAGRDVVTARIEIKAVPKMNMGFEELAETLAGFDEVETVYLMSGSYDLALTISGKSFKEVALFVAARLAPLESVQSTATSFVLRKYKERGLMVHRPQDEREVTHL